MRIVCLGSVNIDRVYSVEEIVREGATVSASHYAEFAGGKGMNQSVALGRAGAEVSHFGSIGPDGLWLKALLDQANVCTQNLHQCETSTGHAVIQVNSQGKNCIIVVAGANAAVTEAQVDHCLAEFSAGDLILMQNETSCVAYAMLGGTTALWLNLVGIMRNILYCFHRKNKILYTSLPILLALIMTVMSVFLWEGYHSLFFVVGLALNTLAMGYFNPQNLRKSLLLTSSLILIYNLFIPSIGGTINEIVAISSAVIGLIRYRKQKDIAASES